MKSEKRIGRTIGILLLLQLAAGLTIPFILLGPIVPGSPTFLTAGAENAFQIRGSVLIAFLGSVLTVSIGVTLLPVLRKYSKLAALWLVTACALSFALDAVHGATVMSMLSFSQAYVKEAASADQTLYQIVGLAVAAARRWAHVAQLVAIGGWIFVFYASLFRFALVPRWLAFTGIIGILLQFTGVTLMMLLGYPVIGAMAMPMLPIQIIVSVWLIVKGFNKPVSEPLVEP